MLMIRASVWASTLRKRRPIRCHRSLAHTRLTAEAVGQLAEDAIDPVAHVAVGPLDALGRLRVVPGLTRRRRQQGLPVRRQPLPEPGDAIVAVPQDDAPRRGGRDKVGQHRLLGGVGRGQDDLADQAGPGQAGVQAEAVEGLAVGVVLAVTRLAPEAAAEAGAGEPADGDGHAVDDLNAVIGGGGLPGQPAPDQLLDVPEVGGLTGKSRAASVGQGREEVSEMAAEVGEEMLVAVEAQELAGALHRQHLGVGQSRGGAAPTQALHTQPPLCDLEFIVNGDKHGYNQCV